MQKFIKEMNKYKVSVVIPTFNRGIMLEQTLKSVLNQTIKPAEIIVVDNASTTQVNDFSNNQRIKYIKLKKNIGVTGGRNFGIKKTSIKSDYILFLDHDIVCQKDMLEKLLEVFALKRDIGVVTPKIYYLQDKKRIWSAGTKINLWSGQILFRGGIDKGQFDQIEEVQVSPAVMLVKKTLVKRINGFDDKYFATYEDTAFCFKVIKSGFKVFYQPKAICYHDLPVDKKIESERLLKRLYWVGRNRVLFMRDYGRSLVVFSLFLPIFFVYYLYLSVRYGTIKDYFEFVHGNIDGIRNI